LQTGGQAVPGKYYFLGDEEITGELRVLFPCETGLGERLKLSIADDALRPVRGQVLDSLPAQADPVPVRVISTGRIIVEERRESAWAAPPRRVLVIDQVVTEGDKPPRSRQWRIHEVAPGRYEGTLSDAISPVEGRVDGNRLTLRFTIKGGFKVQQDVTLSPDGRRADNLMTVSTLGVTVAVLAEDIRRD
jgi:hypothetical protein